MSLLIYRNFHNITTVYRVYRVREDKKDIISSEHGGKCLLDFRGQRSDWLELRKAK